VKHNGLDPVRSQLYYRELAEHLPNSVVYIFDRALRIVFAGGSLMAKSRWPTDALLGQSLAAIVPPSVFAQAEPHLLATLDGSEQRYELTYPTGETFDVRTTPLPSADSAIAEILVVALDITERKRVEAALAESEGLLRATLDSLTAEIAIVDARGIILAVNRAWREFAQANTQEADRVCEGADYAAACTVAAAGGCVEARQWLDGMQAVLSSAQEVAAVEYACHTPTEQRWFVGRITRLAGEGPVRLVVAHENITARTLAERARRESEATLKRSQEVAHVGHWTWNTVTNVVTWSDEMKRIFGLDPATFDGDLDQVMDRTIHPDDLARLKAMNAAVIDRQQPTATEYRVVWGDGTVRHVSAIPGDVILDATGSIVRLSGVVQDITDQTRQVRERELVQEQLHRQERLAAVGQLAAGIAHDFNNIMSVISIYAELTSQAPGLAQHERARTFTIIEQTQRATRMIRQILDFSRQSVFARQPLNLLPLLKEEEKLLRQTLPENIEIGLEYVHGEYFLLADATRMQQLVMNLAINARDAMPSGGRLTIALAKVAALPEAQASPTARDGAWLRIDVQDTGTGIAPEHMGHVFEPYFTTKEPGKGTGLGLAQAHGIVAQHEGAITVTSEVGVGTRFTIYLPALEIALPETDELAPAPPRLHGAGELLLLVEDEAAVRTSLVELLERWNYQVIAATNGEEALTLLAQRRAAALPAVDLIVSDVVMPRLGGIELVKALRSQDISTPVILMSGHTLYEEPADLTRGEIEAWLDKPPNSRVLAQTITDVFGGNRA
jgi:PAS domain S-box-containing protein